MANSISSFRLFFNRDAQVGLPAQHSGDQPGDKWLLKKKSADLNVTCVPIGASSARFGVASINSGGGKDILAGRVTVSPGLRKPRAIAAVKSGSSYNRTVIDLASVLDADTNRDYITNPRIEYDATADKILIIVGSRLLSSPTTRLLEKIVIDPTSLAIDSVDQITLDASVSAGIAGGVIGKYSSKGYYAARLNGSASSVMLIDLTANTATALVQPGDWGGGNFFSAINVDNAGDFIFGRGIGGLFTGYSKYDPSAASFSPYVTASIPANIGRTGFGVYFSPDNSHYMSWAQDDNATQLQLMSWNTASGAQVDAVNVRSWPPGLSNRARRSGRVVDGTTGESLITAARSNPTEGLDCMSALVDNSGSLTLNSHRQIAPSASGTAPNTPFCGYNSTTNSFVTREESGGFNVRLMDYPSFADAPGIVSDVTEFTQDLSDLELNALYPAMFIPTEESESPVKNVSVLISTFTGGRFDGSTPTKGNFLVHIKEDEDDNGFEVIERHEINTLDSSCVLSGPGSLLELMHLRQE